METATRNATTEQLPLLTLLGLFLIPGALITVVFVAIAPFIEAQGFPPIAALLVAIALVLVPFELGIVWRASRHQGFDSAVPYRRSLPIRDWLWLVPALIVAAFVGFGVSMAIEPAIIDSLFGWLPDWFVRPIDPDRVREYSREAWLLTLGVYFLLNGFIGPIVESCTFAATSCRGWNGWGGGRH